MSSLLFEREQLYSQVEVLANSQTLHGSESLCRLLRYLAKHAVEQPGLPLKEYQIATEVFGRRANFDPQSDSTIRVQAGRLRAKLTEYYHSEGVHDLILVELPKGTYLLHFSERPRQEPEPTTVPAPPPPPVHGTAAPTSPSPGWRIAFASVCVLLLMALAVISWLEKSRKVEENSLGQRKRSCPRQVPANLGAIPNRPCGTLSGVQQCGLHRTA